jgi:hypothetical protein
MMARDGEARQMVARDGEARQLVARDGEARQLVARDGEGRSRSAPAALDDKPGMASTVGPVIEQSPPALGECGVNASRTVPTLLSANVARMHREQSPPALGVNASRTVPKSSR